jgi:parallel beta-helix repeat protein
MKDWCKKKWAAFETILKLLKHSEGHTIKEKTVTFNTSNRELQYSMHTKNSRRSEMDKSKRHRDKKKVYSSYVPPFFGMSLAVIIFMLVFAGVGVAGATNNYYVATWGSDSYDGTSLDYPWQHPSYAAQQAQAGDTIFLMDGTWIDEEIRFANSGTASKPIVMKAYPGSTPTLYCTHPEDVPTAIYILNRAYIIIDGITVRHYAGHISARSSNNIQYLNCSVYTERDGEYDSIAGLGFTFNSHDCIADNCLVDGDAWNSIQISGRTYFNNNGIVDWHYQPSTHITISNCEVRNNSLHNLVDFAGTSSYINIINNELHDGWAGVMYNHQGHPDHLFVAGNKIHNCSKGIYFADGISDSIIENNEIYNLDTTNAQSIRISAYNYGEETFTSPNNIIRNNYCYGDVSYEMCIVGGDTFLIDSNDCQSEYGDTEYRIAGVSGSGILRDPIGETYRVRVADYATVKVEYTDSRTFSVDGSGEYNTYTFSDDWITINVLGSSTGTISGTVIDNNSDPIQGATVSDGTRSDDTDSTGNYTIENVPTGTYTITVTADGYEDESQSGVVVNEAQTTTVNFQLTESEQDTTQPSAITDLSTVNPTQTSITLTWTAPGDDGNTGTASLYDVRYSTTEIFEANWNAATQCTDEPTPQVAGGTETFTVTGLAPNTTYYFALKTADEVPNWADISNCASEATLEGTNLAAEWHLDDGNGTTAVDTSGNGNDGTLVNNPAWVKGKIGKALSFDGTNDYVDCGQSTSLKITGAITVEAWVNWTGAGNPYFVTKSGGPGHRSYDLSGNEDGTAEFRVGGADCNTQKSSGTITIPAGEWVHLAGTYEPSRYVRLFVDGALAKENIVSIPASQGDNGLPWYIGAREGNQGWFNGTIDEVKIYNRALSADEIRADYEANGTNLPPVADPNNPYIGTEGVPLHFKGKGSYDPDGSIVAYLWTFGDGNNATEVNPTHIYAQDGTYTVTLTVTDNEGATNTSITTATIADTEPTADFSATPTSGKKPLTVAFTDNSTSYDGIMAWNWDFNNDSVTDSTVQNPTYEYAEEGVYTVSLSVTENDGDSDSMTKVDYITVTKANEAPFTPTNPSPFDGATDVPVDADLSWNGGDPDAGDTETYDVYFGTSTSPLLVAENHTGTTYDQGMLDYSTEYYWQIVAKDNHGAFNESAVWSFVTASGSDLAAEWHLDDGNGTTAVDTSGNGNDGTLVNNPAWVDGKIGKALRFDGTNDYVHCGQDSSLKITDAITVEAWVNWTGAGNPYFVTKSGGPGQRSYDLSGNEDGTVEFRVGGADCNTMKSSGTITIPAGEWVHLAGTYEPSSYVRLFVDGALAKENIVSIPASQGDNGLPWYIGAREGNQGWLKGTIDEVKIYNRALSADEIRADYEANGTNLPPVADPNGPYTGMELVPLQFNGSGSYDPDGSIVSYLWDFGDGNNATEATPTHIYAQNGTYTVTLTVTDNEGATDTSTTTADIESDLIPPYTTGYSPAKDAIEVAKNTTIVVHVKDDGAGVDITSIVMTVNGITVAPTITGTPVDYTLTYVPSVDFECGQIVYVTVDAHDLATAP